MIVVAQFTKRGLVALQTGSPSKSRSHKIPFIRRVRLIFQDSRLRFLEHVEEHRHAEARKRIRTMGTALLEEPILSKH